MTILAVVFGIVLTVVAGMASPVKAAGLVGQRLEVCILPAVPGMTAAGLFADPGLFDCATKQSQFPSGNFWVLSTPVSRNDARNDSPIAVRTASVWQTSMTLYALYDDGAITRMKTDDLGATHHLQLGAIVERTLPPRHASLKRLLWHIEGAGNLRGIVNGAHIATPRQSAESDTVMAAIYAGFGGLCLALLVYNMALWGALRHPFQLVYCAMVLGLSVYAFSSSGAIASVFPGLHNTDRLRLNYVLLAFSASAGLLFAKAFFEPRVFKGWLGHLCAGAVALTMSAAMAFALLAPYRIRLLDTINSLSFIPLIAMIVPILWRAWAKKSDYFWLFAVAWSAPVFFAAMRIANNLNVLAWHFWLDNSTIISMALEALLSSLAIAYRIYVLSRERDLSRVQENAARVLADIDPLTGLYNRRAFMREVIGRQGMQTLLLADLDHFKRVNDTFGHDVGDDVLRIFAHTLQAVVPADGVAARIGGEEFAIVVPHGSPLKAERILARLRDEKMPHGLSVTASIGTCSGPLMSEMNWNLLYRSADQALLDAKSAGRDRVRAAYATAVA